MGLVARRIVINVIFATTDTRGPVQLLDHNLNLSLSLLKYIHYFIVFKTRDDSQKIRIVPGRTKNRQLFSYSSIISSAVDVIFSSVSKTEINKRFNL